MPKVAIILASGVRKDHSINEYVHSKLKSIKQSIKSKNNAKTSIKVFLFNNGLNEIDQFLKHKSDDYESIIALGGTFVEGRFELFNATMRPYCQLAVIDAQHFQGTSWFNEQNHAKPSGYLAAKICHNKNMDKIAFIGGANIPVVIKWNEGFCEGMCKYNSNNHSKIEVLTEYLGSTAKSFQDEHTAFHITTDILRWKSPSVIMQACGSANKGVLNAVNSHNSNPKNRPCHIIFTDFNPKVTSRSKYHKYIVFSVVRELDKAISHWIVTPDKPFKENIYNSGYAGPSWSFLTNETEPETFCHNFIKEWSNACKICNV